MSLLDRWLSRGRIRSAAKRVAREPSARHYAELAHEYALQGSFADAIKVAAEGLRAVPNDAELRRLSERARSLLREGRTRDLQHELASAPRPALWRELCEILLESGRVARAEEVAAEWFQSTRSGEAQLHRARARAERFFADRRRDDGRLAFELALSAEELLSGDPRPLRLHLQLASRIGAWSEARRVLARLLEVMPGDPNLEARFRTVIELCERSRSVDQALREVEKSGRLADEEVQTDRSNSSGSVRPLLQGLAREAGVQAAFYVRGATALVQGPKGATAERTARGVREIVHSCRGTARKLGLGQAEEVRLEGDFGTLLIAPGEIGSAALWCAGEVTRRHEEGLRDLAGVAGQAAEEET